MIWSMYLLLFHFINDFCFSSHVVVFGYSAKHIASAPLPILDKFQSLFFLAVQAPSLFAHSTLTSLHEIEAWEAKAMEGRHKVHSVIMPEFKPS